MELLVKRISHDAESTVGELLVNGEKECFTCEDEPRDKKVKGETRIPAGRYRVVLRKEGGFHQRYLKKFGPQFHRGMLWLKDVPGFEWILIHIGNSEKDTDGCILVGARLVKNANGGGTVQQSEIAYRALYPVVAAALEVGEEVWITINDEA